MVTYQDKDIDLATTYTIEYIDNQADLDYVSLGKFNNGEPWERYKKKVFDDIDSALSVYMIMYVREDILDIKLFEQIKISGETIREQFVEPTATTSWAVRMAVNKEMENTIVQLKENAKTVSSVLHDYECFIRKYGAEKAFKEYQKEISID